MRNKATKQTITEDISSSTGTVKKYPERSIKSWIL